MKPQELVHNADIASLGSNSLVDNTAKIMSALTRGDQLQLFGFGMVHLNAVFNNLSNIYFAVPCFFAWFDYFVDCFALK